MSEKLSGAALQSHGELVILRLLVESMLTSLQPDQLIRAVDSFHAATERLTVDVLGGTARDELLAALQRAVAWQWYRLDNLDVPLPPGVELPEPPS